MKPIDFPESNVVYGEGQEEYLPLPSHVEQGVVTSCWKGTWLDRLRFLFTGRMWIQQLTFGEPLQPQRLATEHPIEENPAA